MSVQERLGTCLNSYYSKVRREVTGRQMVSIFAIVLTAVFLRLWNLSTWFNRVHDYDEGAWVVAARLISQGRQPYTEFFLVHPPLYEYLLAGLYMIFGYDFMYARYLSVALSLAGIAIIGYVGFRIYNINAAIIALGLTAFNPINVFTGRRAVQEPLGIIFLAVALLCLAPTIRGEQTSIIRYCVAGISLGLMVATKLVFLPAVLAIGFGVLCVNFLRVQYSGHELLPESKRFVVLVGSTVVGFLLVTAHLWLTIPQTFISQTILTHIGRESTSSLLSYWRGVNNFIINKSWLRWYYLPMFLTLPAILLFNLQVIYNNRIRQTYDERTVFFATALLAAFVLAQNLSYLPRYYISLYPFMTLGLAGSIPSDICPKLKRCILSQETSRCSTDALSSSFVVIVLCVFLVLSMPIPFTYHGYDVTWKIAPDGEHEGYGETADYLESQDAEVVYSSSPIITALTSDVTTIYSYESFAFLHALQRSPKTYAQNIVSANPDYIILDPWVREWSGQYSTRNNDFVVAIRDNADLIKIVPVGENGHIGIYQPTNSSGNLIFNGEFLSSRAGVIGWSHTSNVGEGDTGTVTSEDNTLNITVFQDGKTDSDNGWVHAGNSQTIDYPTEPIPACIRTSVDSTPTETSFLEAGAAFTTDDHRLMLVFSQTVDEPVIFEQGSRRRVILPAEEGFHTQSFAVDRYWPHEWGVPERVNMELYVAAHAAEPGQYSLSVRSVGNGC